MPPSMLFSLVKRTPTTTRTTTTSSACSTGEHKNNNHKMKSGIQMNNDNNNKKAYCRVKSPQPPQQSQSQYTTSTVGPKDVLCGRGNGINNTTGNRAFRKLVNQYRASYVTAKRTEKVHIATNLIGLIHQSGGKFLEKKHGNLWIEVSMKRATEKACQALREDAKETIKKTEKEISTMVPATTVSSKDAKSGVGVPSKQPSTSSSSDTKGRHGSETFIAPKWSNGSSSTSSTSSIMDNQDHKISDTTSSRQQQQQQQKHANSRTTTATTNLTTISRTKSSDGRKKRRKSILLDATTKRVHTHVDNNSNNKINNGDNHSSPNKKRKSKHYSSTMTENGSVPSACSIESNKLSKPFLNNSKEAIPSGSSTTRPTVVPILPNNYPKDARTMRPILQQAVPLNNSNTTQRTTPLSYHEFHLVTPTTPPCPTTTTTTTTDIRASSTTATTTTTNINLLYNPVLGTLNYPLLDIADHDLDEMRLIQKQLKEQRKDTNNDDNNQNKAFGTASETSVKMTQQENNDNGMGSPSVALPPSYRNDNDQRASRNSSLSRSNPTMYSQHDTSGSSIMTSTCALLDRDDKIQLFQQLKQLIGHCAVSPRWKGNPYLHNWVDQQR